MHYATKVYAKTARETAARANSKRICCSNAAAKLQAVHDAWRDKPNGLDDALMFNRRLWMVFIDAVMRDDNQLPAPVRDNLTSLGIYVMGEIF